MQIFFENTSTCIAAKNEDEHIIVRCPFSKTDCGEDESLDIFVVRHGGPEATAQYLKICQAQ